MTSSKSPVFFLVDVEEKQKSCQLQRLQQERDRPTTNSAKMRDAVFRRKEYLKSPLRRQSDRARQLQRGLTLNYLNSFRCETDEGAGRKTRKIWRKSESWQALGCVLFLLALSHHFQGTI